LLPAASGKTVTVNYTTANGTAIAPGDYTPIVTPITLTFSPGEIKKDVFVTVVEDLLDEVPETALLNLSGTVNALIADAQGTGTILDEPTDDQVPTVSIGITDQGGNPKIEFGILPVGTRLYERTHVYTTADLNQISTTVTAVDGGSGSKGAFVSVTGSSGVHQSGSSPGRGVRIGGWRRTIRPWHCPERRQQCLSTRGARLPVAVARTPLEPELLAGSAIPNNAFGYSRFVPIMHSDATSYPCNAID